MRVWVAQSRRVPSVRSLHLSRAAAEASVGWQSVHLYEFVEVEMDVVFLLINGGDFDQGGGTVAGVFASWDAAERRRNATREQEIELWELENADK